MGGGNANNDQRLPEWPRFRANHFQDTGGGGSRQAGGGDGGLHRGRKGGEGTGGGSESGMATTHAHWESSHPKVGLWLYAGQHLTEPSTPSGYAMSCRLP